MPDRQHPDEQPSPRLSSSPFAPPSSSSDDSFELLLRSRLTQLAEHAPTTVRSIDEIRVEHVARTGERAARRAQHRGRRSAGIGATIAALAGAVGITTVALTGAGTAGAASPEEAVRSFLDAAQAEDVFGMIDALDPLEVPAARSGVERGRADAVELDIVTEGFQLDGVDGVDLELSDLAYTTEAVLDDVSVVNVSGAVSFQFDPASFPFGEAVAEAIAPDLQPISESRDLADVLQPSLIATVERDGRWYVSGSFTIGEYARRSAELAMPTQPLLAVGAATPEAAAEQFWAALLDLDAAAMLSLAAPGEGDALLAYGPLILDAWNESVVGGRDEGFVMTLESVTNDVVGEGDRRRVEPIASTITGMVPAAPVFGVFDPTVPTVISTWDGRGIVVIDAGVAIPATLDGYDIDTDFVYPDGLTNFTMENEDGTVQPLPEQPAAQGPAAVRIERAGGCTTYSGEGVINLFGSSSAVTQSDGSVEVEIIEPADPGPELVGDDQWRNCSTPDGMSGLVSVLGLGSFGDLPALEVVEVGGSWYVSPIGTSVEALLGLFDVIDGGTVADSFVASAIVGTNRQSLTWSVVGSELSALTDECQAISVADDNGVVTGLVAELGLRQLKDCSDSWIFREGADPFPPLSPEPMISFEGVPASTVP